MNLRWKKFIQYLTVFFIAAGLGNNMFSQNLKTVNSISNKITDKSSFFEVQKTLNDYWKNKNAENGYIINNGEKAKVPDWKRFKRWEYYWEQRVNQKTGEFPKTTSIDEYQKYLNQHPSLRKETAFNESWTNLGTNSSTGGYAGIGRINCIAFHPSPMQIHFGSAVHPAVFGKQPTEGATGQY